MTSCSFCRRLTAETSVNGKGNEPQGPRDSQDKTIRQVGAEGGTQGTASLGGQGLRQARKYNGDNPEILPTTCRRRTDRMVQEMSPKIPTTRGLHQQQEAIREAGGGWGGGRLLICGSSQGRSLPHSANDDVALASFVTPHLKTFRHKCF